MGWATDCSPAIVAHVSSRISIRVGHVLRSRGSGAVQMHSTAFICRAVLATKAFRCSPTSKTCPRVASGLRS
eukprot:scaffold63976_cov19-Prasinocladus_malaysianus.AAC.1